MDNQRPDMVDDRAMKGRREEGKREEIKGQEGRKKERVKAALTIGQTTNE